MTDENPLDLRQLDPGDPPDVVRRAVRRFRWWVVLLTVGALVIATTATVLVVDRTIEARNRSDVHNFLGAPQLALLANSWICTTPTYELDGMQVGLVSAAPMPGGGWALLLVLHSERRLVEARERPDGSSFPRHTIVAAVGGTKSAQVGAQPGATWGEATMEVPEALGDTFDVEVRDPQQTLVGSFTVDLNEIACDF